MFDDLKLTDLYLHGLLHVCAVCAFFVCTLTAARNLIKPPLYMKNLFYSFLFKIILLFMENTITNSTIVFCLIHFENKMYTRQENVFAQVFFFAVKPLTSLCPPFSETEFADLAVPVMHTKTLGNWHSNTL